MFTSLLSNDNNFREFISKNFHTIQIKRLYGDELAWASIWLYRATNESTYLNDAETFYTNFDLADNPWEFSWDSKTPGVELLKLKFRKSDHKVFS